MKFTLSFLFLIISHSYPLSNGLFIQEQSQSKIPTIYNFHISTGYGNIAPTDIKHYYKSIIDKDRQLDIPIKIHSDFNRTIMFNAGITLNLINNIGAGIAFGYYYSPAYSNFNDYTSTLKINGSINSYDILIRVRYRLTQIGKFQIMINPQIGICHSYVSINKTIKYNEDPESNYDWRMSKRGFGFCVHPTIGTLYSWQNYFISLECGYKLSAIQSIHQKEKTNNITDTTYQEMYIGMTGFNVNLLFGISL